MIRIAVVDDDKNILYETCKFINDYVKKDKIIDSFENSMSFFETIDKQEYDIVFLDIEMPEINGFDLAESLKSVKPQTTIFFLSNYEEHVYRSFVFKPLAFIRKWNFTEDIIYAFEMYEKENSKSQKMCFFHMADFDRSISITDIMYFESVKHDIFLRSINDKFKLKSSGSIKYSMKYLSEKYENLGFIRVHKSFLVNYRHIYRIKCDTLILKNSESIYINPHNVKEIKKIYQQYIVMEV